MHNDVILVCGNKGSVGKSVASKALIEWYRAREVKVMLADGDPGKDVAKAYYQVVESCETFDLTVSEGWADFTDWICTVEHRLPIVANLPDGVTEKTLYALHRYKPAVDELGFETKALFVMNTLPDCLILLPQLRRSIKTIYPVKNLHFGKSTDFAHYNKKYGRHFETIHFPRLQPRLMNEIREAELTFEAVTRARPNEACSTLLARLEMERWLEQVYVAFDEVMEG